MFLFFVFLTYFWKIHLLKKNIVVFLIILSIIKSTVTFTRNGYIIVKNSFLEFYNSILSYFFQYQITKKYIIDIIDIFYNSDDSNSIATIQIFQINTKIIY